ncbi:hypothetical protein F5882DRAFT_299906, partial [Hyaloscypha sp. PMI_1271]
MVSSESSKRSSISLETTSERQNILNWLSHDDYRVQQSANDYKRAPGTGEWLINNAEFQEWLATRKQTLFCPGDPGAGKTIMTSGVIDHLYALFGNKANVGITHIYFNIQQQHEQKLPNLLASLLRQLVQTQPSIPGVVGVLYEQYRLRGTRPSVDEIFRALLSVAGTYSMVFIIFDALDECPNDDGGRDMFLSRMFHLQDECGANLFVTSRPYPDLEELFEGSKRIELRPSDRDIRIYLESSMSTLPPVVSHDAALREEIVTAIGMAAQGSILLAKLQLDSLIGRATKTDIRNALKQLPRSLDEFYHETMSRIEHKYKKEATLARMVLTWITHAKRPLTLPELQHALSVEDGDTYFDEDKIPDEYSIVSVCEGLISIDKESTIIQMVHYTAKEYFYRMKGKWFPDADRYITICCVTYL